MLRVGIDLVCVDTIADAVRDHGEQYLARVYTARERADCGDLPNRLAARFAAKEAAMKVLQPGPDDPVTWGAIEIAATRGGALEVHLAGTAAALATAARLDDFSVSVATAKGMATAVVIATASGGGR